MRLALRAWQPERDPRPAPRPAVFRNLPTTRVPCARLPNRDLNFD